MATPRILPGDAETNGDRWAGVRGILAPVEATDGSHSYASRTSGWLLLPEVRHAYGSLLRIG
jgi:hypothetical protein